MSSMLYSYRPKLQTAVSFDVAKEVRFLCTMGLVNWPIILKHRTNVSRSLDCFTLEQSVTNVLFGRARKTPLFHEWFIYPYLIIAQCIQSAYFNITLNMEGVKIDLLIIMIQI